MFWFLVLSSKIVSCIWQQPNSKNEHAHGRIDRYEAGSFHICRVKSTPNEKTNMELFRGLAAEEINHGAINLTNQLSSALVRMQYILSRNRD